MATITSAKLAKHRQALAAEVNEVTWTKSQVNAAVQAVVDLLLSPSSQTQVNNSIETASPGIFNASQKQRIFWRAVQEIFDQET